MEWSRLCSDARLRQSTTTSQAEDHRTQFERDYDRVIFNSAFRRLQDKTQVFPLESHDFIRTRLTHSCEVAAIGRSLANSVARKLAGKVPEKFSGDFGTIVSTACLLHDIGNPPFGHSGEEAIGSWFKKNAALFNLDEQERADLENFEGNAFAFRLVTRLQSMGSEYGINLTVGTLGCLLKYPCSSTEVLDGDDAPKSRKKFGYFKADTAAFDKVLEATGMSMGKRHPLTCIMEAADDVAYSAVDIEDAIKKRVIDIRDVQAHIKARVADDEKALALVDKYLLNRPSYVDEEHHYQHFKTMAVGHMVASCVDAFVQNYEALLAGDFSKSLTKAMSLSKLCKSLQGFAVEHVYPNRETVIIERRGRSVIHGLMDVLWEELTSERRIGEPSKLLAKLLSPARANPGDADFAVGDDYRLAIRAADYVAGMTDTFAVNLHSSLLGVA